MQDAGHEMQAGLAPARERDGLNSHIMKGKPPRLLNNKKQNKMKTTKQTATATAAAAPTAALVDFSPLSAAMLTAWNGSVGLSEALIQLWNEHHLTVGVADFRKQFIAWAMSKEGGKYSEDWAKDCLIKAGIRVRALRSDSGETKPAKIKTKVERALVYLRTLDLTKAEVKALVTALTP